MKRATTSIPNIRHKKLAKPLIPLGGGVRNLGEIEVWCRTSVGIRQIRMSSWKDRRHSMGCQGLLKFMPIKAKIAVGIFSSRYRNIARYTFKRFLTDNGGTQFTDRFSSKVKQPSGKHAFDQACQARSAVHRLIPP